MSVAEALYGVDIPIFRINLASPVHSRNSAATMAKSRLISALDTHKGKNYKLIKQKKQQKEAAKRIKAKAPAPGSEEKENVETEVNGTLTLLETGSEGWESEAAEDAPVSRALTAMAPAF